MRPLCVNPFSLFPTFDGRPLQSDHALPSLLFSLFPTFEAHCKVTTHYFLPPSPSSPLDGRPLQSVHALPSSPSSLLSTSYFLPLHSDFGEFLLEEVLQSDLPVASVICVPCSGGGVNSGGCLHPQDHLQSSEHLDEHPGLVCGLVGPLRWCWHWDPEDLPG